MILTDLVSVILRIAELVFAAIVAGLNGEYLHAVRNTSSWDQGRFIYAEVVAGIAIFFALIWLFPFSGSFTHWPLDLVISISWFVAFGLIVNVRQHLSRIPSESRSLTSEQCRPSAIRAAMSSTGTTLRFAATNVESGRLSLRSPSCPPFVGLFQPSWAFSGSASVSLELIAVAHGIVALVSRCSVLSSRLLRIYA